MAVDGGLCAIVCGGIWVVCLHLWVCGMSARFECDDATSATPDATPPPRAHSLSTLLAVARLRQVISLLKSFPAPQHSASGTVSPLENQQRWRAWHASAQDALARARAQSGVVIVHVFSFGLSYATEAQHQRSAKMCVFACVLPRTATLTHPYSVTTTCASSAFNSFCCHGLVHLLDSW